MKNVERFSVKFGEENKEFAVRRPNAKQLRAAQTFHSVCVAKSLQQGMLSRVKMQEILEQQEIWGPAEKAKLEQLRDKILAGQKALQAGGIRLAEARTIALSVKEAREELQKLLSIRSSGDSNTAEGYADNERFNFLLVESLVYNDDGKPVFKNLDDMYERTEDEKFNEVVMEATRKLLMLLADLTDERDKLPENAFLKKYSFIDEKYRLVDKQGRLIDEEGRLINEEGRFINEAGELVDIHGNRVDSDGNYVVESQPFLDDNDNPV